MTDETGNLADILVIVPDITEKAELCGDEDRKHIDEHHQVETLAVEWFQARQHEGHDQNGQLDTKVFHRILEIRGPQ